MSDRDFRTVEKMLSEGMVEGQMHVCLRDAGRLAGGMLAAGKLKTADVAALEGIAVGLSKNKGEGARKWQQAVEFGRRDPVEPARSAAAGGAYGWDDAIYVGRERKAAAAVKEEPAAPVVDERWVEADEIPEPAADFSPGDMIRYLEVMFEPDEYVGIVAEAWLQEDSGRWLPKRGFCDMTRAQLVDELRQAGGDLGAVIGDPNPEAGAWVRVNPLDGLGVKDANVSAFRHALIEADSDELGKQLALIRALQLPCSAIVHSGGKSIHAIVRVDAADAGEYRARVDRLYKVCSESGLKVDNANRNPSRLSRLPGVSRAGRPQYMIAGRCGLACWEEWTAWVEETHDDLPDPERLDAVFFDLPALAPELIPGMLREGHKMRLTGSSKAGKSFSLIELCAAIAEGREWMGVTCRQGPVLYINLELDRPSCLHRFRNVYAALGWEPVTISAIDVWNLRGHAVPLDKLAPKLIRRAVGKGYAAVVIDPIYKLQWGDENDAGDVARFCNQLDRICHELGASVIDAHHHSKGVQGQKRSIDRGSGSGVFGRDPDAVLDMIELEISAERRQQLQDRLVEGALTALAAAHGLDIEKVPVEARAPASAFLLAFQQVFRAHAVEAAAGVYESRVKAAQMSGWRMEGTLREFPPLEPRRVWFAHPVHVADQWDLLKDAKAAGEEPPWMEKQRVTTERRKEETASKRDGFEEAVEACGGSGVATTDAVAEAVGVGEKTIRNWCKKNRWGNVENSVISLKTGKGKK